MTLALRQFDRAAQLTVIPPDGPGILVNPDFSVVAGVPIRPQLRIAFKVEKSLSPEPNTASIKVWNLSKQSRDRAAGVVRRTIDFSKPFRFIDERLETQLITLGGSAELITTANGLSYVKLSAGYGAAPAVIFEGNSSSLLSEHRGTDWITEIVANDGGLGTQKGIANKAFESGTPLVEVLKYLVRTMGLVQGTPLVVGSPTLPVGVANTVPFVNGFVACGRARDVFSALLLSVDVEWFVDDGEVFLLDKDQTLPQPPVVVSAERDVQGLQLLSKPRRLESDGVEIRSLLAPPLRLGRRVTVVSGELAGDYRLESLQAVGDNRRARFATTAQLRSLSPVPF